MFRTFGFPGKTFSNYFCFAITSTSVLNRCIPKPVKDLSEGVLNNLYGLLNNWDTLEQILGDLYNTWEQIIALTIVALGKVYHVNIF